MTAQPKEQPPRLEDLPGKTITHVYLEGDRIALTLSDGLRCTFRAESNDHGEPMMSFDFDQAPAATVTTPKKAPKGRRRPIAMDEEPDPDLREAKKEQEEDKIKPSETIASEVFLVFVHSDGSWIRAHFPKNTAPTWLLDCEGKIQGTASPDHAEATALQAQLLDRAQAALTDDHSPEAETIFPEGWLGSWLPYLVKEQRPVVLTEGGIVITAGMIV